VPDVVSNCHPGDGLRMKWPVIAVGLLLGGCSDARNSFVVDVSAATTPVTVAAATLCDKPPVGLKRQGQWFVGSMAARCEGSGRIRLTHADGSITDCRIGYVTASAEQWWTFELRGRTCV
jgi:hypothetical protein